MAKDLHVFQNYIHFGDKTTLQLYEGINNLLTELLQEEKYNIFTDMIIKKKKHNM